MSQQPPPQSSPDRAAPRQSRLNETPPIHLKKLYVMIPGKDKRSKRERLTDVLGRITKHILLVVALGLLFIAVGEYVEYRQLANPTGDSPSVGKPNPNGKSPNPNEPLILAGKFLTGVGEALIIAAVVGIAYEVGTHIRAAENLVASLVSILHLHSDRILDASSEIAIENAMKDLCRERASTFSGQFSEFALAVARLEQSVQTAHKPDMSAWASDAYLEFITAFHRELTNKTKLLAAFAMGSTGTDAVVAMPDAQTLADNLVTKAMETLKTIGGRYYAVSDIATWEKLDDFREIQKNTSTVSRQRLFVLGLRSDKNLPPRIIYEILKSHYDDVSSSNDTYEIRITTLDEYRKTELIELADAQHFGIFAPKDRKAVAFLVRDENIANFRLIEASAAMLTDYSVLWARAGQLTPPQNVREEDIKIAINDHLMAYFISRMPRSGLYRGVSWLSDWQAGHYDRVFKASLDTIRTKGIRLRRILVLKELPSEQDMPELILLLSRHWHHASKQYDWRLCLFRDLPKDIRDEMPLALMESGGDDDTEQLVLELAQPHKDFETATPGKELRLSELFDEFWRGLPKCKQSVKILLPNHVARIFTRRNRAGDESTASVD